MPEYFYDYHLTREDLLTGWEYPTQGLYALLDQLEWLYQVQGLDSFIAHKLNFYLSNDPTEEPLSPELAVFKRLKVDSRARLELRSWSKLDGKPAPEVAFEFTAKTRWQWETTLKHKTALYGQLGVKELFVYDGLQSWSDNLPQLVGWRYTNGERTLLQPNQAGWLWSEELLSWVEGHSTFLILRDKEGQLRQTEFQVKEAIKGRNWLLSGYLLEDGESPEEYFLPASEPQDWQEKMFNLSQFLEEPPAENLTSAENKEDEEDDEDGLDEGLEPAYYFDRHPTREDGMGRTPAQSEAVSKLLAALYGIAEAREWFVAANFATFRTSNPKEYPLEPDVTVFKSISLQQVGKTNLRSWKMALPNRPLPDIVFEVSHPRNGYTDLYENPHLYREAGIKEYFAFDPHYPLYWERAEALVGWRNTAEGQTEEISPNLAGWLWSEELASWVAAAKGQLNFYDADGKARPIKADWYLK